MHRGSTHTPGRRAGFTLIELLVAITIIIILAGLALALLPTANDHQKATQGAGMVQGWLLIAKQRALRDQKPRGIRLLIDPSNPTIVTQLQYIEQPDDFSGGQATTAPPGAVTFTGVDLTGGFNDPTQQLVQPGDLFETPIQGTPPGGSMHQITAVTGPQALTVNAGNPLPLPVTGGTSSYRIVRMPRVAVADPTLNLPKDIAIDLSRSIITSETRPNGVTVYDIMFSPSGPVMRQAQLNGRIILWVRDVSQDGLMGDQTLITVYSRTGLIAACPANPVNGYATPYTYTQDGRSSGL
jgi:prepilin-type N-terminal cleavage/methylation domain-containing protein